MPKIEYGSVDYTRRLNTGDYSHKDVVVSLSFEINEGEDPQEATLRVGRIAEATALALTGEARVTETTVERPAVTEDKKPRQSRKAAADPMGGPAPSTADAMGGAPASTLSTGPALNAVGKPVDPMGAVPVVTGTVTQPSDAAMGGTSASVPDTAPAVAEPAQVAPATGLANGDLTKAIMSTMLTLSPVYGNEIAGAKVGELIREFAPEVAQIPVDKRPDFVSRLKTLA